MKKFVQIYVVGLLCCLAFPAMAQKDSVRTSTSKKRTFSEVVSRALHTIYVGEPFSEFDPLPTTHSRRFLTIGMGQALDDYLSPIPHEGIFFKLKREGYKRERQDWLRIGSWQSLMDIHAALYRNPVNGSGMQFLQFDGAFGPAWNLLEKKWLKWDLALMGNLVLGSTIKSANTNNVFNLKLSAGLDLATGVLFPIKIKEYKMYLHYKAQLSALHLTFHPGFGQPYYDYIGGENGAPLKFYLTQPWNRLRVKQMLTADIPFAHSTLILGFEHGYTNMRLNNRTFRDLYFGLVLGYSFDYFKLSGSRSIRTDRIDKSFHF